MSQSFLDTLQKIVGKAYVLTDLDAMAGYVEEQRKLYKSTPLAVVRPVDTSQVAAVVSACRDAHVCVVPQGGNTGLVGGTVADGDIVLSLGRMNRIRQIDAVGYTITVDAGCVLQNVRDAANDVGCVFPLSLGAQGSCQIGGNLAANVGGVNTLHYGTARDLVLGLEVVLPDGRVWNGLRALTKDNSGYSLRNLFVGSEGTLGVITGAVLRLAPAPFDEQTALCGFDQLENVLPLLDLARRMSGDSVTAFELICRRGIDYAVQHIDGVSDPMSSKYSWYALIEFSSTSKEMPLRKIFEAFLECAFEDAIIDDAVIAESKEQAKMLWRMREEMPHAQKPEGASIKHDVSVPVREVPDFIVEASAAVQALVPNCRPVPFGHVGDGNIHFNISRPEDMSDETFLGLWSAMNRVVHDIVHAKGGSFSAEHGVGRLKVDELVRYRSDEEMTLLRQIKSAIDPENLMNPKVLFK